MRRRRPRSQELRDRAAKPTLTRIQADCDRVSGELKPLFSVIERRIFDESFNANALWRESGVSRNVSTRFGAELGLTPWAYITERRIEVGGVLLGTTTLPVWEIAHLLGYTESSFSKAFRRARKTTPMAYRLVPASEVPPVELNAEDSKTERTEASMAATIGLALQNVGAAAARRELLDAEAILRADVLQQQASFFALSLHEEGAARAARSDVDVAYDRLSLARRAYALAGDLPVELSPQQRMLAVSFDTDDALASTFCTRCRATLHTEKSFGLRTALRSALSPVSRNLDWFEICCDDCYRVVWAALSRARLGLEQDAWKAWWLSETVDLRNPEAPPSRGRIIAALDKVERGTFGDQQNRKEYCDLAVGDAIALNASLLEAQARLWRGSVLRKMARLPDAKEEFGRAAPLAQVTPWLEALLGRMEGILAGQTNDYTRALKLLRAATDLYEVLDLHTAGLLLIQQGIAYFNQADYDEAISLNKKALPILDDRRDPLINHVVVPLHLTSCYALLHRWESAESALSSVTFDRKSHLGLAATEALTRACLELLRGRPKEALHFFEEAGALFDALHRPTEVALAASYSIEANVRLGERARAIEKAEIALRFFQAARCSKETLETLCQLRSLLGAEVDAMAVVARVRSVAKRNGGWLPEPAPRT